LKAFDISSEIFIGDETIEKIRLLSQTTIWLGESNYHGELNFELKQELLKILDYLTLLRQSFKTKVLKAA